MADITQWTSVQQVAPTDALRALIGKANSFADWPIEARRQAMLSILAGVALGHVPREVDEDAIVGTAALSSSGIELRATWTPPQ